MKGIVFTEFLSLVESQFGADMVDDIIDDAAPPSGGAYTAVGTYSHEEMAALATALSERTAIPISQLYQIFGEALFARFATLYPHFFTEARDAFGFLQNVDSYIHVEVKKLYPDAELPRFETLAVSDQQLKLRYISSRHLEDFAEGLVRGSIKYFREDATIARIPERDGAVFIIERTGAGVARG